MRDWTPKKWYTLWFCVWLGGTIVAFCVDRQSWWRTSGVLGVFCLATTIQTWNDNKREQYNAQLEADRKAKIAKTLAAMDEAMRWGRSAFRHDSDPWDDGDQFNPTVYAEYVGGTKKYLVRCYTLWGTMSVYEQIERGTKIGLDEPKTESPS